MRDRPKPFGRKSTFRGGDDAYVPTVALLAFSGGPPATQLGINTSEPGVLRTILTPEGSPMPSVSAVIAGTGLAPIFGSVPGGPSDFPFNYSAIAAGNYNIDAVLQGQDSAKNSRLARKGITLLSSVTVIYSSNFDEATNSWPTTSLGGLPLIVTPGGTPTLTHLNTQAAGGGSAGSNGALLWDNASDFIPHIAELPVTAGKTYNFEFRGWWENQGGSSASGAFWVYWVDNTATIIGTALARRPTSSLFGAGNVNLDYTGTGIVAPAGAVKLRAAFLTDGATPFAGTYTRWTRGRGYFHRVYLEELP